MPGLQDAILVAFQLDGSSKPLGEGQFVGERVVVHHPVLHDFHHALFQCAAFGHHVVDAYSSQFFHHSMFFLSAVSGPWADRRSWAAARPRASGRWDPREVLGAPVPGGCPQDGRRAGSLPARSLPWAAPTGGHGSG